MVDFFFARMFAVVRGPQEPGGVHGERVVTDRAWYTEAASGTRAN